MELLLNLLWLTLALSAIWLWRREPAHAMHSRGHRRGRPFLLLICILVLLFPVVSATDDLHPMRAEMEESNPSKRTVRQAHAGKTSAWLTDGVPPARLIHLARFFPERQVCGESSRYFLLLPSNTSTGSAGSRAPPANSIS